HTDPCHHVHRRPARLVEWSTAVGARYRAEPSDEQRRQRRARVGGVAVLTNITPIGASDSKAACEQRIESMKGSLEATKNEQNIVAFYTTCLPDTVDPASRRGSEHDETSAPFD